MQLDVALSQALILAPGNLLPDIYSQKYSTHSSLNQDPVYRQHCKSWHHVGQVELVESKTGTGRGMETGARAGMENQMGGAACS